MGFLLNHLWQSTLFASLVALLCFALRKNRARTRYWLWLAASLKFLLPFSLLVSVGQRVDVPVVPIQVRAVTVERVSGTFAPVHAPPPSPSSRTPWLHWPEVLTAVWGIGVLCLAAHRARQWRMLRDARLRATPLSLDLPLGVMSSPALVEPGVVGIFRPVLMLPEKITDKLTPEQLQAIMEHELCHVRYRDNLTAAVHMGVEAIFWFHPLVWWIGTKLVEERERACDESVLSAGGQPEVYAESIVNVCKFYVASPLPCASGVSGSDLKRRIKEIMSPRACLRLTFARKLLLAGAALTAVSVPVVIGVLRAQILPPPPAYTYGVVSIRRPAPGLNYEGSGHGPQGGMRYVNCPVAEYVWSAYGVHSFQVLGLPEWTKKEHYDISFTADNAERPQRGLAFRDAQNLYNRQNQRLQAVLRDRFGLVVRAETREMPIYALTVAKGGHKLRPPQPGSRPWVKIMPGELDAPASHVDQLTRFLPSILGRTVINETGLDGPYDVKLKWAPNPADDTGPSIFTALTEQLGLRLESRKGPVPVFIVEKIEKPTEN